MIIVIGYVYFTREPCSDNFIYHFVNSYLKGISDALLDIFLPAVSECILSTKCFTYLPVNIREGNNFQIIHYACTSGMTND